MTIQKKNPYITWKHEMDEKFKAIPLGCAFTDKQFEKEMVRLGVTSPDELVSIGSNCFIRETDKPAYLEFVKDMESTFEENLKSYDFVYSMFFYELNNNEYCISGDIEETLDACDLTLEDVENNAMYQKALTAARKDYMKYFEGGF